MRKHLRDRVKIFLVPYLILATTYPFLFIYFTWIRHRYLPFKEDTVFLELFLPLGIILGTVVIVYWRRHRIINDAKLQIGVFYFAVGGILATTMTGQNLVAKLTYQLSSAGNTSDINLKDYQRYLKLKNYYIDTAAGYTHVVRSFSDKKSYVNLDFYLVAPIYDRKEKVPFPPRAWYARHHKESVSNEVFEDIREDQIDAHIMEAKNMWQHQELTSIIYFENTLDRLDRPGFLEAIRTQQPSANESIAILVPRFTPFEERTHEPIKWFVLSIVLGTLGFLFIALVPKLDYEELQLYKKRLSNRP